MDAKTVFALLFLLAVLFVVGLSLGATHRDDQAGSESPAWVEGLGDLLVRKQPLEVDDLEPGVRSGCREQLRQGRFTLGQGQSCVLHVKEMDAGLLARTRTLDVQLVQGGSAQVAFDPRNEDLLTTKHTLKPGAKPVELRVGEEGGTITIFCTDACQVAVPR